MKLHLDSNIVEGTPEELVKYQELLEEKEEKAELLRFGHEHQLTETEQRAKDTFKGLLGSLKVKDSYTSSTDIKVGDRVKVLKSELGAEGEATVTAVLEDGDVELAGTNREGEYSTNWSNHVSNLEKIEAESTEDDKEEEEVYNDVYDKGAFYTVNLEAEDSALPVGAILQHQHGRMFRDSQGNLCIISNSSYVNRGHVNGDEIKKQRFELAKQLGIRLTTTTDFAVEAKGKYFKVTEENSALDVGDLVTISEDDKDDQPLCKDEYGNLSYAYLHDLELLEDDEADDNAPMGYTFWYIDGTQGRNHNVLKATLDGDFEDSTGTVSGLIKPLDREDAREEFEGAKHEGGLLKYYPALDMFVRE